MTERRIIGLTGGIASGKTAVSKFFSNLGAVIIDADEVSKQVSQSTACNNLLQAAFPSCFDGGTHNRRELRNIVFNDEQKRKLLNEIMHPLIFEEIVALLRQNENSDRLIVLVAPLLFEAGLNKITAFNICVTCDAERQLERLVKRDSISKELAEKMIASQLSDAQRSIRCDFILENNGSLEELFQKTEQLYIRLLKTT